MEYKWYGGEKKSRRMSGQRVWKIIKDLGKRFGVDTIHPHPFRHAWGVELLKRSGGNLRAVQEHLRHTDIQTTTISHAWRPRICRKTEVRCTRDFHPVRPGTEILRIKP
jgi:site-specific recombinase XerD